MKQAVWDFISNALKSELELQITQSAAKRVRYHLSCFTSTSNDRSGLQEGVNELLNSLDIAGVIAESEARYASALASNSIDALLMVFNRKSLADQVSTRLGLKHAEYRELVLRLAKGPRSEELRGLFLSYLPNR